MVKHLNIPPSTHHITGALKIAKVLHTSVEGLIDKNDIMAKYYALPINDQETINKIIETLYAKIK